VSLPRALVVMVYGEEEFLVSGYLAELQAGLGDATTASMNTTRLEAGNFNIDSLRSAVLAAPFLAPRRLVIVNRGLSKITDETQQDKLIHLLEQLPGYALVVFVEPKKLVDKHWLNKWLKQAGERTAEQKFEIDRNKMPEWIAKQARKYGGELTGRAAAYLASLSDEDTRFADQEIQKLLAFVNYRRPVDYEDVEQITVSIAQADIFALVDALGHQDAKKASSMLRRLLEEQDPRPILGMVVRQFRLLIQARELLDGRPSQEELARALHTHPYVAGKVATQARRFTQDALERAHHRLAELELAMNSGLVEDETGLETWVADFTIRKV
jgi:DNA polymerase-3 subunit delta